MIDIAEIHEQAWEEVCSIIGVNSSLAEIPFEIAPTKEHRAAEFHVNADEDFAQRVVYGNGDFSDWLNGNSTQFAIIPDLSYLQRKDADDSEIATRGIIHHCVGHELAHAVHWNILTNGGRERNAEACRWFFGSDFDFYIQGVAEIVAFLRNFQTDDPDRRRFSSMLLAKRLAMDHDVDKNPLEISEYELPFGLGELVDDRARRTMQGVFDRYKEVYKIRESKMGESHYMQSGCLLKDLWKFGECRGYSAGTLWMIRIGNLAPKLTLKDIAENPFSIWEEPEKYVARLE